MSKNKTSLIVLKDWILNALKARNGALNIKQISWEIGLKGSQYRKQILRAIGELIKDDLIMERGKYKYQYKQLENIVSGVIDINKSGHGYVFSTTFNQEIFIHRKNRLNSLNKDTVSIKLITSRKKEIEGAVTKVLSRNNTKFIGTIKIEGKNAFFIGNNRKIGSDFFIPTEKLKNARNHDRVIVEFTDWPLNTGCPFGKVIKVLDKNISLQSEIESNIAVFNIRNSFSSAAQKELKSLPEKITKKDLLNRRDFRKEITFTIDPEDAKDFDDALSVKFLSNNNVEIGVHIADVSHFVKSKSEIDKEAFLRAFSVYFPGRVVPMLPEKLSNKLCSLRPNEDKLTFSIAVEISNYNAIESIWIGKSIINSNQRFSYEAAEEIIINKKGLFFDELITLDRIAKKLRIQRINSGSINFERSDISFRLDHNSEPLQVVKREPLNTHKLVEEFMLLANKIVANQLSKLPQSIYRVHDVPDLEKIKEIGVYLTNFDSKNIISNVSEKNSAKFINHILMLKNQNINNNVIENLILRSMAKAKYSTKNIGHYGLGFEKYTHFTSPIRRYADLMIHRLLHQSINNQKVILIDVEKKCAHFSSTERIYIDAERKTNKFIQLKLLENSIGKVFQGSISGVARWGIYVDLIESRGEGLVSINDLNDDRYYHDASKHAFIGRKSGKKYTLGQNVLVEIRNICLFKGEMDLFFINQ